MKVLNALVASALVFAGSSAFAGGLKSVTMASSASLEMLRWSSQCVVNTLEQDVQISYLFGADGNDAKWQDMTIEQGYGVIFNQEFATQDGPAPLTVKFLNRAEDGMEKSYVLDDTVTIVRPFNCDRLENYEFQATTNTGDGVFDLVHIER